MFVKEAWILPIAVDVTHLVDEYNSATAENSLRAGEAVRAQDKCCWPQILCPLGCALFVGEDSYHVQLHHYFTKVLPDYNYFNANKDMLVCRHPAYPVPLKFCTQHIRPGLYFDEEKGVSIVGCSVKKHLYSGVRYLHSPLTPFQQYCPKAQEPYAALTYSIDQRNKATVNPRGVAKERTVNLYAGPHGASVCRLSLEPKNVAFYENDPNFHMPLACAFQYSEPLRQLVRAKYPDGDEIVEDYQNYFQERLASYYPDRPDMTVEKFEEECLLKSTYYPRKWAAFALRVHAKRFGLKTDVEDLKEPTPQAEEEDTVSEQAAESDLESDGKHSYVPLG